METRAGQPPEGRLIEEARERLNISQNKAAKRAGMSGTRWRQLVYGEASGGAGVKNTVVGNPETLAKMAEVVGLAPEDLREAGRDDAARELTMLLREESSASSEPDAQLRRVIELWQRLNQRQRRAMLTMLEDALSLGETAEGGGKPEREDERRTG